MQGRSGSGRKAHVQEDTALKRQKEDSAWLLNPSPHLHPLQAQVRCSSFLLPTSPRPHPPHNELPVTFSKTQADSVPLLKNLSMSSQNSLARHEKPALPTSAPLPLLCPSYLFSGQTTPLPFPSGSSALTPPDPPAGYPSLRKAVSPLSAGELLPVPPLPTLSLAHPSQPGLPVFPE